MRSKISDISQSLIEHKDEITKVFNNQLSSEELDIAHEVIQEFLRHELMILDDGTLIFNGNYPTTLAPIGNIYIAASSYMPILFPLTIALPAIIGRNKIIIKPSHRYPGASALYRKIFKCADIEEVFDEQTSHHKLVAACNSDAVDKVFMAGTNRVVNDMHQKCMAKNKMFMGFRENKNIAVINLGKNEQQGLTNHVYHLTHQIYLTAGLTNTCPEIIMANQEIFQQLTELLIENLNEHSPKSFFRKRHLSLLEDIAAKGGTIQSTNAGINIAIDITHEMKICTQDSGGRIISIIPYDDISETIEFIKCIPPAIVSFFGNYDIEPFHKDSPEIYTRMEQYWKNLSSQSAVHYGTLPLFSMNPQFTYSSHFGKWGGIYSLMECTKPKR